MREMRECDAKALEPAKEHYTAYVGPATQYDLMGATQFRLLCSLGLREHHNLLDFGCGSLRAGRLLIPYLEPSRYYGIDPNKWLIEEAITHQIGHDMVRIKQPHFAHGADFEPDQFGISFNYILAQSIFSHSGPALTAKALHGFARLLAPGGLCAVTFIIGDSDTPEGWHYGGLTNPGIVEYRVVSIQSLLADAGLKGRPLPWFHPRQQWWVLGKTLPPDEQLDLLKGEVLLVPDFAGSIKSPSL